MNIQVGSGIGSGVGLFTQDILIPHEIPAEKNNMG